MIKQSVTMQKSKIKQNSERNFNPSIHELVLPFLGVRRVFYMTTQRLCWCSKTTKISFVFKENYLPAVETFYYTSSSVIPGETPRLKRKIKLVFRWAERMEQRACSAKKCQESGLCLYLSITDAVIGCLNCILG